MTKSMKSVLTIAVVSGLAVGTFAMRTLAADDKDDPIKAVEVLAPDIRTVHVKDANRPKVPGTWGEEVPLGKGQTNTRQFLLTLKKVGYTGPLFIEREVGDQQQRFDDIAHGVRFIREVLA